MNIMVLILFMICKLVTSFCGFDSYCYVVCCMLYVVCCMCECMLCEIDARKTTVSLASTIPF